MIKKETQRLYSQLSPENAQKASSEEKWDLDNTRNSEEMCRAYGPMSFAYILGLLIVAVILIETVPLHNRCHYEAWGDHSAMTVVCYWLLHLFTIALTVLALAGVHIGRLNLLLAAFMATLVRCSVSFYLRIFELKHKSWFLCSAEETQVYTRLMGFLDMLFLGSLWLAWMAKRAEASAEEESDRLSAVAYYRTLNSDSIRSVADQALPKTKETPVEVETPQ